MVQITSLRGTKQSMLFGYIPYINSIKLIYIMDCHATLAMTFLSVIVLLNS